MKDIWILSLTAAIMIAAMLTGQFIRGDFTRETASHASLQTDPNGAAVEQDGRLLININKADAEMLTRIDGIGPTLSERIIAYREEYGEFTSLDELLKVDGIGTKTLASMREWLICLP